MHCIVEAIKNDTLLSLSLFYSALIEPISLATQSRGLQFPPAMATRNTCRASFLFYFFQFQVDWDQVRHFFQAEWWTNKVVAMDKFQSQRTESSDGNKAPPAALHHMDGDESISRRDTSSGNKWLNVTLNHWKDPAGCVLQRALLCCKQNLCFKWTCCSATPLRVVKLVLSWISNKSDDSDGWLFLAG